MDGVEREEKYGEIKGLSIKGATRKYVFWLNKE